MCRLSEDIIGAGVVAVDLLARFHGLVGVLTDPIQQIDRGANCDDYSEDFHLGFSLYIIYLIFFRRKKIKIIRHFYLKFVKPPPDFSGEGFRKVYASG